jgi:hypothetical protein
MRETCGSDIATACANNIVNQLLLLIDRVNDAVANTCNQQIGSATSTTDSAVTACVNRVLATVAAVQQLVAQKMVEACGSSDPNACAANLISRINVEVNRICASIPGDRNTTGVNECIDKTWQIVNTGVEAGKQKMRETCGSDIATACANNVINNLLVKIEMAHDTAANICKGYISNTSTTDSAVTNCVSKVLETLGTGVKIVCPSGDVAGCLVDLASDVDDAVRAACGALPVEGAGEVTGVSPGAATCVTKALGAIEMVIASVCGSTTAPSCPAYLVERLESVVGDVCGEGAITADSSLAPTSCVDDAVAVVLGIVGQPCSIAAAACGDDRTRILQALLEIVFITCDAATCDSAVFDVMEAMASHAEELCSPAVDLTARCARPNVGVSRAPGQPFSDFVLASGSCESKVVTSVLYMPPGVTSKGVTTEDLSGCGTGVGEFRSAGSPGAPEPTTTTSEEEVSPNSDTSSPNASKCYTAKANWVHSSITIQGVANDDLAWLRTTGRRLWGCDGAWWSEARDDGYWSKVFTYAGVTNDFPWWNHYEYPIYEYSEWHCHPPSHCAYAGQHSGASWRIDPPSPCGNEVHSIVIRAHVLTLSDGGKVVSHNREGHCNGLRYPEESKVNNRRDESPDQYTPGGYGGEEEDVYCFARPRQIRSCTV